jgi:hypothetical protein
VGATGIKTDKELFKRGEEVKINKCNYKLISSHVLFEKVQQWCLFSRSTPLLW